MNNTPRDAQSRTPPTTQPARHACRFVSDLHLFSSRSLAAHNLPQLEAAAATAEHFVLGGDIFDFRWSRTGDIEKAAEAAIAWLAEICSSCRQTQFHYVLGNHDHVRPFIDRLAVAAPQIGNLIWDEYVLRLGSAVFLHGDLVDTGGHPQQLADSRGRPKHEAPASPMHNWLYDMAVASRVHVPIPYLRFRKRTLAQRILTYLEHLGPTYTSDVRNIYFGHTHTAFSDFQHAGIGFHNAGAWIKGVRCRVIDADLGEEAGSR